MPLISHPINSFDEKNRMGLLTEGKALTPERMKEVGHYIREHGITQFIHTWEQVKDVENDDFRFGDEIECGLFVVDDIYKTVRISLRSAEVPRIVTCYFT